MKSAAWKDILKQKGWDDAYMPGDEFAKFLRRTSRRASPRSIKTVRTGEVSRSGKIMRKQSWI